MARSRPIGSLDAQVRRALVEDRASNDRTTRAVLPARRPVDARITAQASGVLSGTAALRALARARRIALVRLARDGARVHRGSVVALLRGDARDLLAVERTALNFLMHLSGVASATARAVRAAARARRPLAVYATRKTLPGLRDLEKAAVVHGGGRPHRRDLSDGILVKNNHLALVPLGLAVRRAGAHAGGRTVQVEVRGPGEALRAVAAGARAILVDNAAPGRARAVVRALERAGRRDGVWVELSGGITPASLGRYGRVGADAVSLGAITHSAPALPFHLRLVPGRLRRRSD